MISGLYRSPWLLATVLVLGLSCRDDDDGDEQGCVGRTCPIQLDPQDSCMTDEDCGQNQWCDQLGVPEGCSGTCLGEVGTTTSSSTSDASSSTGTTTTGSSSGSSSGTGSTTSTDTGTGTATSTSTGSTGG